MNTSKSPIYFNITALGVAKIILVLVFFYILYEIREILAVLFVSLILSSAFDPWVDWLAKKKIPRGVSMGFFYVALCVIILGIFALIIPPIAHQATELSERYPFIADKVKIGIGNIKEYTSLEGTWNKLTASSGSYPELAPVFETIFSQISGVLGAIFTFFLVLVITFYMVVEEGALKKVVWSVIPESHQVNSMRLVNAIQQKIGLWIRGQLILSLTIFVFIYVGLLFLKVDYALVLALIAGLTEFVPYLGPVLAALPAIFLAFTQKPILALFVGVFYYIVQLVENNIIVPKIMQKVVGLNPIVSITVLLIGFQLAGVIGAILSVPVATAVKVVLADIFEKNAMEEEA